ncbi:MAG: MarR family winged helix-turn-helix transcriptional regulator [Pseudomonadales bacterium]
MANKKLIIDDPELTLDQKVMGLLACIAQEKKVEIDERLSTTGLSFLQLNLLHALSKAPEKNLTVSQLKGAMVDENPNVSRTLNKLATMGLVEKVRSDEDQRTVYVSITHEGEQAHEDADKQLMDMSTGLKDRDLKQLFRLLQNIE